MRQTVLLILALIVAVCVALWGWTEAGEAKDALKEQIELRAAAEARLSKVQSSLRRVESNYATSELRLRQLHNTLTDRPTDRRVYNVLCERANCVKVESMPTSID